MDWALDCNIASATTSVNDGKGGVSRYQQGGDCESEIVAGCMDLVARDARELFQLYGAKVKWLQHEHAVGDVFAGWGPREVAAKLAHLKDFYENR